MNQRTDLTYVGGSFKDTPWYNDLCHSNSLHSIRIWIGKEAVTKWEMNEVESRDNQFPGSGPHYLRSDHRSQPQTPHISLLTEVSTMMLVAPVPWCNLFMPEVLHHLLPEDSESDVEPLGTM